MAVVSIDRPGPLREPLDGARPAGAGDTRSSVLVAHLDAIVATAARAPSVHNTQPWRFRLSGNELEVYAIPSRRLDRVDPQGRRCSSAAVPPCSACDWRCASWGTGP